MALYTYASSSKARAAPPGITEFEILKASHKFLREGEDESQNLSWEDKLASKYYSSLYREFAVCDLKHYKSGNFALRWRTEDEVLSGAGETTCGNTRCEHHDSRGTQPSLSTLELPFVYAEHGETKSALVKVVLCHKCVNKLMWKRRKDTREKEESQKEKEKVKEEVKEEEEEAMVPAAAIERPSRSGRTERSSPQTERSRGDHESRRRQPKDRYADTEGREGRHRRRSSRSRSPRPRHK